MPKKKTDEAQPDFEEALGRLESIVEELESGELALERALTLFEEGVQLGRRCSAQLEEAESKISLLVEKADARLAEELLDPPISSDDEDGGGIPF